MNRNAISFRQDQKPDHGATKILSTWPAPCYRWLLTFFSAVAIVACVNVDLLEAQASQASIINREHKIKAAYLYNFARYVEWPKDTFENAKTPFIIGIVGNDPIIQNLEKLAKTRTIDGRPIHVKVFIKATDVTTCQILFLSPTLTPEFQKQVLKRMSGKNVLLVGQTTGFLDLGGVIDFVVHQNRVRLVVALNAAHRENLKVSAKLLRVAQVVK